jgi:hypothetical protein
LHSVRANHKPSVGKHFGQSGNNAHAPTPFIINNYQQRNGLKCHNDP